MSIHCENSTLLLQPVHPHILEHDYCKIIDVAGIDCTETTNDKSKLSNAAALVDVNTTPAIQEQSVLNIPLVKSERGRPRKRKSTVSISRPSKRKKTLSTSISYIRIQPQSPPVVHAALQGFLDGRMFSEICTNHRISPPELKALQGSEWLSDSVINAAQSIISTQFPHKCGFQDVLYGQGLKFKKMKKFIQILHVPSPGHWITVTNYGAPEDTVFIYDSLDEPAPESAVRQVVSMLHVTCIHILQLLQNLLPSSGDSFLYTQCEEHEKDIKSAPALKKLVKLDAQMKKTMSPLKCICKGENGNSIRLQCMRKRKHCWTM